MLGRLDYLEYNREIFFKEIFNEFLRPVHMGKTSKFRVEMEELDLLGGIVQYKDVTKRVPC
jgi:hypothetical protein